jgi:hypothetical protein
MYPICDPERRQNDRDNRNADTPLRRHADTFPPWPWLLVRTHIQLDPSWGVIAGMRLVADPAIDAGIAEARRQVGAEEQMIDAQSRILLPMLTEIIPEGVDALIWIARPQRIGPPLSQQSLIEFAAFGLEECIL